MQARIALSSSKSSHHKFLSWFTKYRQSVNGVESHCT